MLLFAIIRTKDLKIFRLFVSLSVKDPVKSAILDYASQIEINSVFINLSIFPPISLFFTEANLPEFFTLWFIRYFCFLRFIIESRFYRTV